MSQKTSICHLSTSPGIGDEYRRCQLCPRRCRVDRTQGETGFCGESAVCRVAQIAPHFGEEPPITGTRGSGTVFFSGCSCGCFFCQNHQISSGRIGIETTADELAAAVNDLIMQRVHNINLVTPDHFWPHICQLAKHIHDKHPAIPLIFNSSGFHLAELIDEYARHIDIFLPDIKFHGAELAVTCMGCADYFPITMAAIRRMVELKGFLEPFDPDGKHTAHSGVLVRHLALPGHTADSLRILEELRREFGRMLPLAIMSQYHPAPAENSRPPFNRRLSENEYHELIDAVERMGFEQVLLQEEMGDDSFLPDFTLPEAFRGNEKKSSAAPVDNHHSTR